MESGAESESNDADVGYRLKIDELLSKFSASAIEVDNLQSFMDWALGEIGKSMDLSRVDITEFDQENQTLSGRYQWVSEGVDSSIGKYDEGIKNPNLSIRGHHPEMNGDALPWKEVRL